MFFLKRPLRPRSNPRLHNHNPSAFVFTSTLFCLFSIAVNKSTEATAFDTASLANTLTSLQQSDGTEAMLAELEETLRRHQRWHALFDVRVLRAREALGLPLAGPLPDSDTTVRGQLDEQTIAACREAGWGLLEDGQVSAGWMYLRASVAQQEVTEKLGALAEKFLAQAADDPDDDSYQPLQEIVQLALWEGLDPTLGIRITLMTQGTCNAVTAYEQSVAGLPPERQAPVAALLVEQLHEELFENLARDLIDRKLVSDTTLADIRTAGGDVATLLTAVGGLADEPSIHLDASHLQAVLRFARICTDPAVLKKAVALAAYACRLPADFQYPGDVPFTDTGRSAQFFFKALLGDQQEEALAYFRDQARSADQYDAPTAWDVLAVLASRLSHPAEAITAVLTRPAEVGPTQPTPLATMLPPLVELAHTAGAGDKLRAACLERDDLVTFAASLARDANS